MKLNIAVIGHGFVGKAVEYGFDTENTNLYIVDPNGGLNIEDLVDKRIDASFVCVPTPMGKDRAINASIAIDVITYLEKNVSGLIILKSTVTPDIVDSFSKIERFIYNPEFLTERNALHDFEYPIMHVFGGTKESVDELEQIYKLYSICKESNVFKMSPKEASFVKYGMNSFLATKVLWFNAYYDIVNANDCDFNRIVEAIGNDDRIASSHTLVPGLDGKRGFGGACFPKDISAFSAFCDSKNLSFDILKQVISQNNEYRKEFDLDDREKEQNVNY